MQPHCRIQQEITRRLSCLRSKIIRSNFWETEKYMFFRIFLSPARKSPRFPTSRSKISSTTFSSTFGFLRTVENLDCTEESDVRFLIIRCHLAILSDPMFTSWIARLQSRSHIVNNSNPQKIQTALKIWEHGLVTSSEDVPKFEQAASTVSSPNRRNGDLNVEI